MKARLILFGIAGALVVSTAGYALGASGSGTTPRPTTGWWAAMDAMHDSPGMQRFHSQMPAELRAQCDAMHEQMQQMMGGTGGMMGGPSSGGMMGGPTSGGMMGGPSSGGMMGGPSSGGMMGGG